MEYDLDELIKEYGREYLREESPDDELYEMELINEVLDEPLDAIQRAFNGYRYGTDRKESFNPNDDFFYFNGYANLVSVVDSDVDDYVKSCISEFDFIEWIKDNYPDEIEEDDE